MHDDIVDLRVLFNISQHILQLRALSTTGRLTTVNEFFNNKRTKLTSLALISLTLGGDRKAFSGITTAGLPMG
nr:hypothetical protein [Corynebacterium matruchotii]